MVSPKNGTAGSPVSPAPPHEAQEADTADPGQMTELKARQRQEKAGKYGATPVQPYKPPQSLSGSPGASSPPGGVPGHGQPDHKRVIGTGTEASDSSTPVAAETAQKQQKKSWIEIELVDEEDKPVPGEAYRITVPDGSVAEGTLDEKGFARVEGFEKGNCKVSFPNLDKESWHKR